LFIFPLFVYSLLIRTFSCNLNWNIFFQSGIFLQSSESDRLNLGFASGVGQEAEFSNLAGLNPCTSHVMVFCCLGGQHVIGLYTFLRIKLQYMAFFSNLEKLRCSTSVGLSKPTSGNTAEGPFRGPTAGEGPSKVLQRGLHLDQFGTWAIRILFETKKGQPKGNISTQRCRLFVFSGSTIISQYR